MRLVLPLVRGSAATVGLSLSRAHDRMKFARCILRISTARSALAASDATLAACGGQMTVAAGSALRLVVMLMSRTSIDSAQSTISIPTSWRSHPSPKRATSLSSGRYRRGTGAHHGSSWLRWDRVFPETLGRNGRGVLGHAWARRLPSNDIKAWSWLHRGRAVGGFPVREHEHPAQSASAAKSPHGL